MSLLEQDILYEAVVQELEPDVGSAVTLPDGTNVAAFQEKEATKPYQGVGLEENLECLSRSSVEEISVIRGLLFQNRDAVIICLDRIRKVARLFFVPPARHALAIQQTNCRAGRPLE